MKKNILVITFCFIGFQINGMENSTLAVGNPIDLSQGYHDPNDSNNNYPRNPVEPPLAYYLDNTLFISGIKGDYEIQLKDESGDIAYYYNIIGSTGLDIIPVPTSLNGEFELHIHFGSSCFYGTLIL